MATMQVTNTFIINTRAKSSEVNQNFTDVLNLLRADHHNVGVYSDAQPITTSGIAPNAQIKDTQLALFTRAGLIAVPGVITAAAIAGLVTTKYGGTGTDGAFSSSSGTTTLSFGGLNVLVKNYTSFSLTGTAALAFSNPHTNGSVFILKTTGNVTITTSATRAIDLRLMGGAGGTPGAATGFAATGNNGGEGFGSPVSVMAGRGGLTASTVAGSTIGAQYVSRGTMASAFFNGKIITVFAGAGGGGGGQASGNSCLGGTGGTGGGGIYIECAGALNITGTIDVSGQNGTNAAGPGTGGGNCAGGASGGGGRNDGVLGAPANSTSTGASGGGGGGGGSIIISYTTLTANTGTYTVTGGTAGTSTANAGASGNGGDGMSYVGSNTEWV